MPLKFFSANNNESYTYHVIEKHH